MKVMEFAGFLGNSSFFERFCLRLFVQFRPYFFGTLVVRERSEHDGVCVAEAQHRCVQLACEFGVCSRAER